MSAHKYKMRKTPEDHKADLIEQAKLLTRYHEYGRGAERAAKLREIVYLLDALERGEDIVAAKLAMDADVLRSQQTIARLKHHGLSDFSEDALDELFLTERYIRRVIRETLYQTFGLKR